MTGIFVRALIEGHPQSVEIDTLSDSELEAFFADLDPDQVRRYAAVLAGWIRDNVGEEPP